MIEEIGEKMEKNISERENEILSIDNFLHSADFFTFFVFLISDHYKKDYFRTKLCEVLIESFKIFVFK